MLNFQKRKSHTVYWIETSVISLGFEISSSELDGMAKLHVATSISTNGAVVEEILEVPTLIAEKYGELER